MTDLCIPNKKATIDEVTEPNFVSKQENTSAMIQGQWQSFTGKLINPDTTKEFQTTDDDGYELIPFFNWNSLTEFTSVSSVKSINQLRKDNYVKADQAQNLSPETFFLIANPNNVGLTLDDEDASMLNIYDTTPQSISRQAQQMDIK